jgi:hypothetical protein
MQKDTLVCIFDGNPGMKSMQLEEPKQDFLLMILKRWTWMARDTWAGIPFQEFECILYKVHHVFMSIPTGRRLFTPFNNLICLCPPAMY